MSPTLLPLEQNNDALSNSSWFVWNSSEVSIALK